MPRQMTGRKGTRAPATISRPEMLVDGSDAAFRQFIHDTLAFSIRIQEVSEQLGRVIGLSGTQYLALIAILHHQEGGGVGIVQVAQHLHLSAPFMTTEISKLVAAGLVLKKTNPADRRRVLLRLTASAERLLRDLTTVQRPVNDVLFACLSRNDFDVLRTVMPKLVDGTDQAMSLALHLSELRRSQR